MLLNYQTVKHVIVFNMCMRHILLLLLIVEYIGSSCKIRLIPAWLSLKIVQTV